MITRSEVAIGDYVFFIRKLPPFEALKVLGTLQKSFLAPLVSVMKASASGADMASPDAYAAAIRDLSANLDGDQMVKLAKLLLNAEYISVKFPESDAPVKLGEGQINMSLGGVAELLELCMEVVKVNYMDFGQRALSLIGEARSAQAGEAAKE